MWDKRAHEPADDWEVASSGPGPRRVVLLSLPCAEGIDVIGALDVYLAANRIVQTMIGRGPAYATELVSINYMTEDEGEQRLQATYAGTYERLTAVKTKYDPTNFFSMNQNIRPVGRD